MRIIAADSGSAILDENFKPERIVTSSSIVTSVPYRTASHQISDLLMADVNRHDLPVTELKMCRNLLRSVSADAVHIDMTLGGVSISQLTLSDLRNIRISPKARQNIGEILPQLRKLATDIEQTHKVEVLAMGKDSLPVRIAELTAGANSVIHASTEVLKHRASLLLGLPTQCTIVLGESYVTSRSLHPGESGVVGTAIDSVGVTREVEIREFNNPTVRGFRILKIQAKES